MNSPNLTTVPLPPAKGRSIGRIRADQPLEACLRKPGAASKLGKIRSPQMRRIHRPLTTVASHTGSSVDSPTNERNKRL
jgi:hypothetical protein